MVFYYYTELKISYSLRAILKSRKKQRLTLRLEVGRRQHEVTIAPFEGEREITSLRVFPAEFIDSSPELSPRKRLEDRGEKFYSMLLGKQMDYNGYVDFEAYVVPLERLTSGDIFKFSN